MADFISKDFVGTDGQLITDLDPKWIKANPDVWTGLAGVAANTLYAGSSAWSGAYYNEAPPSADYEVSVDIVRGSGVDGHFQAVGRYIPGTQGGYMAGYFDYGYVCIRRIDAFGYDTTIAALVDAGPVEPGTIVKLRLRMEGSTISLFLNNETTARLYVTDTTWTEPGFAGIELNAQFGAYLGGAVGFKASTLSAGDAVLPTLTGSITETSKTTSSISISWPAGADNVGVTAYEVSRDAGSTWTDVGNVLAHTFSGLTASTAYAIRVRAKDAAGNVSTPALATSITTSATSDTTKPVLTGSITIGQKTNGSIAISWPAGSDNVGVTSYEVSTNGGSSWTDTGNTTTSRILTGLAALTSYNLRVRAKDAAGNVSDSPLAATTSTLRDGASGLWIRENTGPVGGSPAGILHNDVAPDGSDDDKWFSFRITDGPVAGLDINPDGTFTHDGETAVTFHYQLEVDGVDVGSPVLVELYDQVGEWGTWTSVGGSMSLPQLYNVLGGLDPGTYEIQIRAVRGGNRSAESDTKEVDL